MVTEYGFQSFPSVSTLSRYSEPEDLYFPSRFIEHRQHATENGNDQLIFTSSFHFDTDKALHSRDEEGLRWILYYAMVNQAEALRISTEHYRRMQSLLNAESEGFTMGALYWQLNRLELAYGFLQNMLS